MPKNRTNTVATSGASAGGVSSGEMIDSLEMAQRLQNRLNQVGSVTVNIESRTRRTNEEVQVDFSPEHPGTASVLSGSGRRYNVDFENTTCDCIHFRTRGNGCRHIDAVNMAIGQINDRFQSGSSHRLDQEELRTAVINQGLIDAQDEAHRQNLSREQEDDGFFYSDNQEQFENKLRHITDNDIPYEYDNVLNGSDITFGLELEFVDGDADAIARDLYELDICGYDRRVGYHAPSITGKWKLERDGSVSDGSRGGELVSPILQDKPETWETIEKICEIAKRHGARISSKCGGHVHMSMEPLDTARQRWRRFFRLIGGYEECIYRAAGGDEGRVRSGHSSYATPFSQRSQDAAVSRMTMEDENDVRMFARSIGGNRYYGMNLTNIPESNRPDTVEFRYFNGSLNPKQIQANVKLSAGIMMASEKARTQDVESENLIVDESMKRRGRILKESMSNNRNESEIMKLVDIIFTRKKDKDALLNVFGKNNWR